jgi:hypothetical protein
VSRRSPIRLSRRRLLAASGATLAAGAPVALAACGSDEDEDVSPSREAELLNTVLAQQLAVLDAAREASSNAPRPAVATAARLTNLRDRSSQALESAISDLGGTPTPEPVELAAAESPVEGLARQLETSIAASLEAIGELSPEQSGPVHDAIVEDAGALAELRVVLGEDPAPDAFVMGPPAEEAA